MKSYAIIVAGGSGSRMRSVVPKQFISLNGLPVLMHTLQAFHKSSNDPQLIVVLPADFHTYWLQLCVTHNFTVPHHLVNGGETRFHSVKNGLDAIPGDETALIAVHDAVRPLTAIEIIDNAYSHAAKHGNAVVAVKSRDSVRQGKHQRSISLLRDEVYLIQTPQTFQSAQLKAAYKQLFDPAFTDDASVVEKTGINIELIEGNYQNIKITFPEDIAIAELLLRSRGDNNVNF